MLADFGSEQTWDASEDAVLGGRLRLRQPVHGHRVGHDAILLAAACPGRAGEHAADLGAGVGAAGLALARRIAGLDVTLVEVDERLAALARENAQLNGLAARVRIAKLDVAASARAHAAAGLHAESLSRVLMNPPFNDPARLRPSPDSRRRFAHGAVRGTLAIWVRTAARLLRPGGTLTFIWRADALDEALQAVAADFGATTVLPIHPMPRKPAIRVLVRATKGSRAPMALLPGFVLNDAAGRSSQDAEAVLRQGASLPLAVRPEGANHPVEEESTRRVVD
jgi:tRNA1(Val) A37 N6-methylase TrmN6